MDRGRDFYFKLEVATHVVRWEPSAEAVAEHLVTDGLTLQQPLHRNGQLPQETLDDGAALGKFVFDFDF